MSTKTIQILNSMTSGTVRYDGAQELTKEERAQARNNINAASLDESGKIPLEQLPDDIGSGGGGLTEVAWEDIKNKPFGEMGIKIEWDGDITDKEHLGIVPGFDFYRISSKPLS